jgi:ribose/xylose/arabinose/galactoside ABC-type transport system permease subunit
MKTPGHDAPRALRRHEAVLLALVIAEWLLFRVIGHRFGGLENTWDILRHSAEAGLLAVAMTPVILSGGIDLSVGSLLGLCAVVLGKVWRDAGLPIPVAALAALAVGAAGGGLNALLITRLRLPPLIVTLGSYSLYRGLAEAITRGVDTFTNFPGGFLALGQESFLGLPAQAPVVVAAVVAGWLLVDATTFGRAIRAIGFSPEGVRHAGIPVARRLAAAYLITGVAAGLASILYTARLGQARADAGSGYELAAVTAVVLGGASIFGGVGSVRGAMLGVAALAILENGLIHARLPREAAGVLTGLLLVGALTVQAWERHPVRKAGAQIQDTGKTTA